MNVDPRMVGTVLLIVYTLLFFTHNVSALELNITAPHALNVTENITKTFSIHYQLFNTSLNDSVSIGTRFNTPDYISIPSQVANLSHNSSITVLDFDLFVIDNENFGSLSVQNRLDKREEKGVEELDEEKLPVLLNLKYHAIANAEQSLGSVDSIRSIFFDFLHPQL